MNSKGTNTFIVPKSIAYSMGWNKCAASILPSLRKLIDTGKAFENVKLEQVIFVRASEGECDHYVNGLYDGQTVLELARVAKDTFDRYGVLLCGQTSAEMQIIEKVMSSTREVLGDHVSIERGLNWQSQVEKYPGRTPIHRGAQLRPYYIAPATDHISLQVFSQDDYSYQLRPKVLNQLAIAHVQNPYPHFFLQAALDEDKRLVFETVSCTFPREDGVDLKFVLGYNNSKLFAWLLYKLIYSNAIRSTRYDEQYLTRMPWPTVKASDQKEIREAVTKICEITRSENYMQNDSKRAKVLELMARIDRYFYSAFRLTESEIAVVEGRLT